MSNITIEKEKERILEDLSEEERQITLEILSQYGKQGYSDLHNQLQAEDYEEIPVDIHTFLHDPRYLGTGLIDEEGRFSLFAYWENLFDKIYNDNLSHANFNILALTGAIGLGKSTEAVILGIYELYKMLCLKNPYTHYGLMPTDLITFAVMNITKEAAEGVAWNKMQSLIQTSPWFLEHGTISRGVNPEWRPPKGIELIYGSQPRHILGRAVFWAFLDEVSFQPNKDVNEQKRKAKEMVNAALRRMQSRFQHGEYNPTILCIASSKRTDQSYMETFIAEKKRQDSKKVCVVDEPQWVVRPDKVSKRWFKVAVGNKFLDSEVLSLDVTEQELKLLRDKGYQIIDVPYGYWDEFQDDVNDALNEIAGISTTSSNKFLNGPKLAMIKTDKYQNMFINEIITVGDDPLDKSQYYDYIDLKRVPADYYSKPLYIHMDLSESGDKTGIAGVWVVGKKPPTADNPQAKDLIYRLAFGVSVKAPKGHDIDFEKNRNFIYWLKEKGFNIKMVTTDTFQSFDTGQMLKKKGYNYSELSVDRTTKVEGNKYVCLPYQYLRSAIYEQRLQMYENKFLTEELLGLEKDQTSGKVDHSPSGINCLTGDTLIRLVDGRDVTIKDLVDEFNSGKINYVYTINLESKNIEAKPIENAFQSGISNSLVKITLDNGQEIRCTPEHRIMLRNGSYIQAQQLIPGDSVMPLYQKIADKGLSGYRLIFDPFRNKWHFEHRLFAEEIYDERYLVHHKNCNKLDNNPNNLIWMSKKSHQQIHAELQTGAHSPEAEQKRSNSIKKVHEEAKKSETGILRYYHNSKEEYQQKILKDKQRNEYIKERTEEINRLFNVDFNSLPDSDKRRCLSMYRAYKSGKNSQLTLDRLSSKEKKLNEINFSKEACLYYGQNYDNLTPSERHGFVIKYLNDTIPGYKENIAKKVSQKHADGKYEKAKKALADCNRKSHERALQKFYESDKYKKICDIERIFNVNYNELSYHEKLSYGHKYSNMVKKGYITNHKIVSIEFINVQEPVYDLTIKDNPNFALSAGIFVHNSKDQADALCGALYTASKFADEFAYQYGEDLGLTTNLSSNTSLNKQEEAKKIANAMDDEIGRMLAEQFGTTLEDNGPKHFYDKDIIFW